MPTLWLLRHGQAAFATDRYDRLSPRGQVQAELAGRRLGAACSIGRLVHGSLSRQQETARAAFGSLADTATIDPRWDEFDHESLLRTELSPDERPHGTARYDPVEMASAVDLAAARWSGLDAASARGPAPGYLAFRAAADAAVAAVWDAGPADGATVAVTSAGVIAAVVAGILGIPDTGWPRLNRVTVNAGLTLVVRGGRGAHVLTFNDHAHLEHDRTLITYR